jgi:pimeloyl-ACP methyl ester carboxylesterase
MQKEIRGSVLHTFPGTRHAVHRTNAGDIAAVIREQLHAI